MSQPKAFICAVLMQHDNKQESRLLTDLVVAPDEEQALVKVSLLAHPGGHDNWTVLSKEVHEVDGDTLRRVAAEVLGWNDAAGAGTTA
jgi:hypothetical protein